MLCCEYLEPVYGGAEEGALGCSEACAQVSTRYSGVWVEICQE